MKTRIYAAPAVKGLNKIVRRVTIMTVEHGRNDMTYQIEVTSALIFPEARIIGRVTPRAVIDAVLDHLDPRAASCRV